MKFPSSPFLVSIFGVKMYILSQNNLGSPAERLQDDSYPIPSMGLAYLPTFGCF